ncbi:MAG: hypothetical protein WBW14_03250 [Candidatus Acidiferrum sp.]
MKLQQKPFRILALLLDTRKCAMEFDGRLNTALMKLRAPLNDKSENPRDCAAERLSIHRTD